MSDAGIHSSVLIIAGDVDRSSLIFSVVLIKEYKFTMSATTSHTKVTWGSTFTEYQPAGVWSSHIEGARKEYNLSTFSKSEFSNFVLTSLKLRRTLSTLDAFSKRTNAKPRDRPVLGSVFRLHSSTVPYFAK